MSSTYYSSYPVEHLPETLTAVWTLLYHRSTPIAGCDPPGEDLSTLETILNAIDQVRPSSITTSVIAVTKNSVLYDLLWQSDGVPMADLISRAMHPILSTETSLPTIVENVPEEQLFDRLNQALRHRCTEGILVTLTEFIECWGSSGLPFRAADTLQDIGNIIIQTTVHPMHRKPFVTAIKNMLISGTSLFTNSSVSDFSWSIPLVV
jgi:hypothetical protein